MKKIVKKSLLLLISLTLSLCLFGCNKEEKENETLKIGYFGCLTASDNIISVNVMNMFINRWNEEGTFDGITTELITYDNGNNGVQDTEMSIKCAQKLIYNDEVQIIVPAQMSNIIQATGDLINGAGIVDIGLGLSATWMTQGWDYVYRSALNNDYQVPSFVKTMQELNHKTISLIYLNTDNCLTFRDTFKKCAEEASLSIIDEEMLEYNGGTGITGQVTNAVNANPDCMFITAMGGEFGAIIKQIRQCGYDGMIYIGQPLTTTEVDSIGDEEVNGVAFCAPYIVYETADDCDNELIKGYLEEYKENFGEYPASDMFFKTVDCMLIIENAVKVAGAADSDAINQAIKTLKIEGCGGTMDFTTGSNECYYSAQTWVYTGQGSGGKPVLLENWLNSDISKAVKY